METPKDQRPKISCLGREWILTERTIGGLSLCYDRRDLQFCWSGCWFVILKNGSQNTILLAPLASFSMPIRNAIFEYQERQEKRLYTPWRGPHIGEMNVGWNEVQSRQMNSRRNVKKEEFATRLLKWRTQHRWTREESAAQLGVSRRTLQEWEQGRRVPSEMAQRGVSTRMQEIDEAVKG